MSKVSNDNENEQRDMSFRRRFDRGTHWTSYILRLEFLDLFKQPVYSFRLDGKDKTTSVAGIVCTLFASIYLLGFGI